MIKNFKSFTSVDKINESEDYYTKEGYISDDRFKNEEELIKFISDNIGKAFDIFAKEQGIPKIDIKLESFKGKHSIEGYSADFTEKEMGLFSKSLASANLSFFGGRTVRFAEDDGKFLFVPYIWTGIDISYESQNGGTNGVKFNYTTKLGRADNGVRYDILDNKWYTDEEFYKKLKK